MFALNTQSRNACQGRRETGQQGNCLNITGMKVLKQSIHEMKIL